MAPPTPSDTHHHDPPGQETRAQLRLALVLVSFGLITLWISTALFHADLVIGSPSTCAQCPSNQVAVGLGHGSLRFIQFGPVPIRPGLTYDLNESVKLAHWWFDTRTPTQGSAQLKRVVLVPLWFPAALATILTAITLYAARPPRRGQCQTCRRDIRNVFNDPRCPTCGTLIPSPAHLA